MSKTNAKLILFISVLLFFMGAIVFVPFAVENDLTASADTTDEYNGFFNNDNIAYISSEGDFDTFLSLAKQNKSFEGKSIVLSTNIYLDRRYDSNQNSIKLSDSIAKINYEFKGTFDGLSYSIVGVKENNILGLFYKTSSEAVIKNLNLVDYNYSGVGICAGLVYENHGTIDNVCTFGSINSAVIGGIAVYNYGTINNCKTITKCSLPDDFDLTTKKWANGIYWGGVCGFKYSGTLANNFGYIVNQSGKVIEKAEGYLSEEDFKEYYNENSATFVSSLVSDGTIDDFFDLMYYSYYFENHTDMVKPKFACDINLYGINDLQLKNKIEYAVDDDVIGSYNFYNDNLDIERGSTSFEAYRSPKYILIENTLRLSGTGADSDPFIIDSVDKLFLMETLYTYKNATTWATYGLTYDEDASYTFVLTKDISLLDEDNFGYYKLNIPNFDDLFIGGGHCITGVINGMFTNFNGGILYDMVFRGEVRANEKGIVVDSFSGNLVNVGVYGNIITTSVTKAGGFAYQTKSQDGGFSNITKLSVNVGLIGDTTNLKYGAVAYDSTATIINNSRSLNETSPFIYTDSGSQNNTIIKNCYTYWGYYGDVNCKVNEVSTSVIAGNSDDTFVDCNQNTILDYRYSDNPLYYLLDIYDADGARYKYSGWKWNTDEDNYNLWAIKADKAEDRFVLCFPEDRIKYKNTNVATIDGINRVQDYTKESSKQIFAIFSDRTIESGEYFNLSDVSFKSINAYYSADGKVFEKISYEDGWTSFDDYYFVTPGTYKIVIRQQANNPNTDASGIGVISVVINYAKMKDFTVDDMLEINKVSDKYYLVGYDGVQYLNTDTEEERTISVFNYNKDKYEDVSCPVSNLETSKVFDGENYVLDGWVPCSAPDGASSTWKILEYYYNGVLQTSTPTDILDTGNYKIELTVECQYYITKTFSFILKVDRKEVTVLPKINTLDGNVLYNSDINDVIEFEINTKDVYSGDEKDFVIDATTVDWESYNASVGGEQFYKYTKSATTTSKYIIYSKAVIGTNVIHKNYVLKPGYCTFGVVKATVPDLDNISLSDNQIEYDGKYHSIKLMLGENEVPRAVYNKNDDIYQTIDGKTITTDGMYAVYSFTKQAPIDDPEDVFKLIDVNQYYIVANVVMLYNNGILNSNYNYDDKGLIKNATLSITPKAISITIKSYTINYNEDAPTIEYEDISASIVQRDDGKTDEFDAPTYFITLSGNTNIKYSKGSDAGTYSIGMDTNSLGTINYLPTVTKGVLTVNKISRGAITLNDPANDDGTNFIGKFYDGLSFSPHFIKYEDEIISLQKTLYKYSDDKTTKSQVSVAIDIGKYQISIEFEANTNYIEEVLYVDFEIRKANLSNNGLYLTYDGDATIFDTRYRENTLTPTYKSSNEINKIYDGNNHTISINSSLLPTGETFNITFYYMLGLNNLTADNSFTLDECGNYLDIYVVIDGNDNYKPYCISGGSLKYNPRKLIVKINGNDTMTYSSQKVSPSLYIYNDNNIFDDDKSTINNTLINSNIVYWDSKLNVIDGFTDAGTYYITTSTGNSHYVIDDTDEVIYTITKANAIIDLADFSKTVEYGSASVSFVYSTTYSIGAKQFTEELTYNVNSLGTFSVKSYDVISITETDNVTFTIINGTSKYIVTKKIITIDDWGIQKHYDYIGSDYKVELPAKIDYKKVSGALNTSDAKSLNIALSYSSDSIINSGKYTVTATITNSQIYELDTKDNANVFEFDIGKGQLKVSIDDKTITYGDIANPTYTVSGLVGNDTDSAYHIELLTTYTNGCNVGNYEITLNASTSSSPNYDIAVTKAGSIKVNKADMIGLSVGDISVDYDGYAHIPQVVGVPTDAIVVSNITPTEAGAYDVVTKITKDNYNDVVLQSKVTINKVELNYDVGGIKKMNYSSDSYLLSDKDIDGITVTTKDGKVVSGKFEFENDEYLKLGINIYKVEFVPDNPNYIGKNGLSYTISATIDKEVIVPVGIDLSSSEISFENNVINSDTTEFTIKINADEDWDDDLVLYINNIKTDSNFYTIYEDTDNIVIEIKKSGQTVYSNIVSVKLTPEEEIEHNDTKTDENKPIEDNHKKDDSGNKTNTESDKKKTNWGLIGGIVGGAVGLIAIGAVAYIVINKKKDDKKKEQELLRRNNIEDRRNR